MSYNNPTESNHLKTYTLTMTRQPTPNQPQAIAARVTRLELELTHIKQVLATVTSPQQPWWERIAGSHANDPTFEAVIQLGQEWRKTAEYGLENCGDRSGSKCHPPNVQPV